jgi:type II secretory pathway pseudopilin PulG
MVEAVIAVLIVGTVLAAGLRAIVGAKLADAKAADAGRATMLAQGLLSEIVRKDYQDATSRSPRPPPTAPRPRSGASTRPPGSRISRSKPGSGSAST